MNWLNEPPEWELQGDRLTVTTGSKTDFWRRTHYGFIRDNGHFYYQAVDGDFTAAVQFTGEYQALYDQAGLMVRADSEHWIKAGVEFTDGLPHLSVVVTNSYSDWSVLPIPNLPDSVGLRVTRHGEAVRVEASLDGKKYQMLRLAYLSASRTIQVGPMCCSPERAGFKAIFTGFGAGAPIGRELHSS
jgi:regulation of enolase protein 1 (concanavalin A-like superfamily)